MRQRLFLYNTASALVKQIVYLVCGFVLPRYILSFYGSNVNGLVASITQFLGFISFLELGIGPVIQSNLYKPLAEKDHDEVSRIMVSAERFFRKIAAIFVVYIVILVIIFSRINHSGFDWFYTGSLILIISISSFAQYYFGISYQLLLNADQRAYVQINLQTITILLNTIVSVILMELGCSIHIVKFATSLIYLLRPFAQIIYVKKHYQIQKDIAVTGEPIKQKCNGFAQHLAGVVVANTDVTVLTACSSLVNVSIYSVYYNVVFGVNNTVMTLVTGLESLWGNMIAKEETENLLHSFEFVEWIMHAGCTFLFSVTAILIAPFVRVYTNNIDDANYIVPVFGMLLVAAYGIQCLRVPYFRIVKAAGHYKQTQNGSIIQMMINIVLSIALVSRWGLNGVAIGTLLAMFYHTTYFAWYLRKNIIFRPFFYYVKYILTDAVSVILCFLATNWIQLTNISYMAWILLAVKVSVICLLILVIINCMVYKQFSANALKIAKLKLRRR